MPHRPDFVIKKAILRYTAAPGARFNGVGCGSGAHSTRLRPPCLAAYKFNGKDGCTLRAYISGRKTESSP